MATTERAATVRSGMRATVAGLAIGSQASSGHSLDHEAPRPAALAHPARAAPSRPAAAPARPTARGPGAVRRLDGDDAAKHARPGPLGRLPLRPDPAAAPLVRRGRH